MVVVDIDGVLADASGRQHFLNNPEGVRDWKAFFGAVGSDPLLPDTVALLDLLDPSLVVVLLSARPGWVFDITLEWTLRHPIRWDLLITRDDGSIAGAAEFKRQVVRSLVDDGFEARFAFDDDERIVDMFRAERIPVSYVHSGYYGTRAH
jgi:hypothetical protein